jgi:hypothetical protein
MTNRTLRLGALAAVTLWSALADAPSASAADTAKGAAPKFMICQGSGSPTDWRCEQLAPRSAETFKGSDRTSAIRILGAPERTRSLSGGVQVLVWDRSLVALSEGGRIVKREECELQMVVARSGIVADALITSDSQSCAKRFGLRG